jgi:ribosomal protein S18 acetylase RimI-like enzyme
MQALPSSRDYLKSLQDATPIRRVRAPVPPEQLLEAATALSWSSFHKEPERLEALATAYTTHPDKELHAWIEGGSIVGIVALEHLPFSTIRIAQIGVAPSRRGRRIGSAMIEHVERTYPAFALEAETDRDAVGFYRALGFEVESLGEKYPGIERFRCRKPRRPTGTHLPPG